MNLSCKTVHESMVAVGLLHLPVGILEEFCESDLVRRRCYDIFGRDGGGVTFLDGIKVLLILGLCDQKIGLAQYNIALCSALA